MGNGDLGSDSGWHTIFAVRGLLQEKAWMGDERARMAMAIIAMVWLLVGGEELGDAAILLLADAMVMVVESG